MSDTSAIFSSHSRGDLEHNEKVPLVLDDGMDGKVLEMPTVGELQRENLIKTDTQKSDIPFLNLSKMIEITVSGNKTSTDEVHLAEKHFRIMAIFCFFLWISFIFGSYKLCPQKNIELLSGMEKNAVTIAFSIQFITMTTKIVNMLFYMDQNSVMGLQIASLTVQTIATISNFLMAFYPCPVMIDQITGSRVHLVRWCEWVVLSAMMTFIIEVVGTSNCKKDLLSAYLNSAWQGISTFAGFLFPFITSTTLWLSVFMISTFFYSTIFVRFYYKRDAFFNLKAGNYAAGTEKYNRAKYSYQLLLTCSIIWSFLIISFTFGTVGPQYAPPGTVFASPSIAMVFESLNDVLSKVIFLSIIMNTQEAIYDEKAMATRRLEELRNMMSAVWESSTDVILISLRSSSGTIKTMVSPTFTYLNGYVGVGEKMKTVSFDLAPFHSKDPQCIGIENNTESFIVTHIHISNEDNEKIKEDSNFQKTILSLGQLIWKAWKSKRNELLMIHDQVKMDGSHFRSEAKWNRCDDNSLIVVLRDVSERFRRFEAEKKALSESTARTKDAEANRFTRHEVKNGLLSAIELCKELKISIESQNDELSSTSKKAEAEGHIENLNQILHEILDTVLAQAMSREVIYGVYSPIMEQTNLVDVLGLKFKQKDRFPMEFRPSPFPILYLDKQLLQYIHRNAVSNACKYGKKDGVVSTVIDYDPNKCELRMKVLNYPGEGYGEILKLGKDACDAVFVQGRRLHGSSDLFNMNQKISSGDGAWIAQKCAQTLKGECKIKFLDHITIFSFTCPVSKMGKQLRTSFAPQNFYVPSNTVGVVIDDSPLQRKLLARILPVLGVKPDKCVILGENVNEIRGFKDTVFGLIRDHPDHYFLLFVDEHLDIDDMNFQVSGSVYVKEIREMLSKKDEGRVLAIIRSANDSFEETQVYKSRAHDFITKTPMSNEEIREVIMYKWFERFPDFEKKNAQLNQPYLPQERFIDDISKNVLTQLVIHINDIITNLTNTQLEQCWPFLWEKFVKLKGDIISVNEERDESLIEAVRLIEDFRTESFPKEFHEKWNQIKLLVT